MLPWHINLSLDFITGIQCQEKSGGCFVGFYGQSGLSCGLKKWGKGRGKKGTIVECRGLLLVLLVRVVRSGLQCSRQFSWGFPLKVWLSRHMWGEAVNNNGGLCFPPDFWYFKAFNVSKKTAVAKTKTATFFHHNDIPPINGFNCSNMYVIFFYQNGTVWSDLLGPFYNRNA